MQRHDIIVIGTSAGGLEPLKKLISMLPADFKASVFIVMHISPYLRSNLPSILGKPALLKVVTPRDKDAVKPGFVYVAPPDHHLLVENGEVLVKKGPRENRFRPSIDTLFRSAAYAYGTRVIGVVLSGLLDDGTSGMWTIKRLGGLCIIQDPAEALYPSMPENASKFVEVDYSLPVGEIALLLEELVNKAAEDDRPISPDEIRLLEAEIQIANQKNAFGMGIFDMGKLTPLTCPECHGSLIRIKEGNITRFRCHTGHAFTANALLEEVSKSVEDTLWSAIRGLEETVMLLEEMGNNLTPGEDGPDAGEFFQKTAEIKERIELLRVAVFAQEKMSKDKLNDKDEPE